MDDLTRRRLMTQVRVSLLVLEELRAAQEEGRPLRCARADMRKGAEWAERELRSLVWNYYDMQTRRAGYR
jgi:hypothetical protein